MWICIRIRIKGEVWERFEDGLHSGVQTALYEPQRGPLGAEASFP